MPDACWGVPVVSAGTPPMQRTGACSASHTSTRTSPRAGLTVLLGPQYPARYSGGSEALRSPRPPWLPQGLLSGSSVPRSRPRAVTSGATAAPLSLEAPGVAPTTEGRAGRGRVPGSERRSQEAGGVRVVRTTGC